MLKKIFCLHPSNLIRIRLLGSSSWYKSNTKLTGNVHRKLNKDGTTVAYFELVATQANFQPYRVIILRSAFAGRSGIACAGGLDYVDTKCFAQTFAEVAVCKMGVVLTHNRPTKILCNLFQWGFAVVCVEFTGIGCVQHLESLHKNVEYCFFNLESYDNCTFVNFKGKLLSPIRDSQNYYIIVIDQLKTEF